MKVAVFGQGYVGLTLAIAASRAGNKIVGFDIDKKLITDLSSGTTYVPGIDPKELLELVKSGHYLPTNDFSDVQGAEILILAVPTPLDKTRDPDLTLLKSATELIAKKFETDALIVNESTSYPGTLRNVIKPILDNSNLAKFQYASAPERVDPGNDKWMIQNTPRVISGLDSDATNKAIAFYSTFCSQIYRAPNVEVAEASKIFENTFRQINIALVNEFSEIAHKIGFSAHEAIKAAATKPFGFLPFFPSIGVGGHCIPVDPTYLSYISKKFGMEAQFINLANAVNSTRPRKIAIRIQDVFGGSLLNKHIQIAGIAYKPDVSDLRESPAIELIDELKGLGAKVSWFDPLVKEHNNLKSEPLDPNADIGLIVTPHSQIDFSIWKEANIEVLDLSANSINYGWPKFL
jgi:UDP-N-acetyl-D-glucosamine dehydrogenase